jgi:pyruvate/2-oxoglutarate dehydrogenase complex dihydrolipoamide dehydrogenase (E3) component
MMTKLQSKQFDLIVIGGGSAGLTAAKFAAQTLKKSCLLIEGAALGGDCTWTGCVPSKSLLASAKAAQIVRNHMITTSSSSTSTSAKWTDIQQRFRDIQQEIYEKDDSPQVLAKLNIQTQIGMATLTSARTVSVQGGNKDTTETPPPVLFEATQGIVLCTGATPKPANTLIPGLDSSIHYITYEDVWNLKELPKRLTVIGGGPVRITVS